MSRHRIPMLTLLLLGTRVEADGLEDALERAKGYTSYQLTVTQKKGKPPVMFIKLRDGQPIKVRTEMGDVIWSLADLETNETYSGGGPMPGVTRMPGGGLAMAAALQMISVRNGLIAKVATPTVTEGELDGKPCYIEEYQLRNDVVTRLYIDAETGLSLKREDEVGGEKEEMIFEHEMIDSVPDEKFELPAGVEVMELPGMPKIPGLPGQSGMPSMPGFPPPDQD